MLYSFYKDMKQIAIQIETSRAYGRALMEGISAYAQERGDWKLRLLPNESDLTEALAGFDGLILRLVDPMVRSQIVTANIPAVDVFGDSPPDSNGDSPRNPGDSPRYSIPICDGNHEKTGKMAAEFFVGRGFRNFGWCGIDGLTFSDRRGAAFCAAIEGTVPRIPEGTVPVDSQGTVPKDFQGTGPKVFRYVRPKRLKADASVFYGERLDLIPDAKELATWLHRLPKPIAVFCCHDYRAYQLMLVATDLKLRIPQDIAILGVDNDTTLCSFAPVPLSSIDPDAFRVGYSAARLLDAQMLNPPAKRVHAPFLTPPKGIVERESTEIVPEHEQWVSDALMFIEKNAVRGISAADVIAKTGKSSTYVERIFRKELGKSVLERILEVRMEVARELLRTTDLQIKAVAARAGFSSPQYFCRSFLAATGMTPKTYREGTVP